MVPQAKTQMESNTPALSRRGLLQVMGSGALAGALGMALPTSVLAGGHASLSDADILNFALNLEYLEAEFYTYAVMGKGIDTMGMDVHGVGDVGATTGGMKVNFADATVAAIAAQIGEDERAHVAFLRKALGKNAVAKPAIKLDALGIGFGSEEEFLTLARAFEDVGVSAYTGAARLISNKDYLEAAARILDAEAYHASSIRFQVIAKGIKVDPLDGKDMVPSRGHVFPVDKDGLVQGRTAMEVAMIVRGKDAKGGAFYPQGMNGKIR